MTDTQPHEWQQVLNWFNQLLGREPDLNGMLFVIGTQELGKGPRVFSKEEKQDLMHIATCAVLATSGYFEKQDTDAEGWPHWKAIKPLPVLSLHEQEGFIKEHIISYMRSYL